jgi:DNA-binding response OmpR family regulator
MRILLVEDNEKLSGLLCGELQKAGFNIEPTFCADEALSALKTASYDLMILDLGLPDQDGMEVLNEVRAEKNAVPILILTARDSLDQKIKGLNAGADDYLSKPFAMEEVVARVHALLRRPAQAHSTTLSLENVIYDSHSRQTEVGGQIVKLTKRETSLLEILLRSTGRVVPKEDIEMQIYGYGEDGSANSIEVLVHRLKKKLQMAQAWIEIHTLRGIGYMLVGAGHEKRIE